MEIYRCPSLDRYRYGRHLVATRNVLPGEVFYSSNPYVLFPSEVRQHQNCAHCLSFAWNGVPCDHCPTVVYCCNECKITAWREYHKIECSIIERSVRCDDIVRTSKFISVRLLIKALREAGSIEELRNSIKEVDNCKGKFIQFLKLQR